MSQFPYDPTLAYQAVPPNPGPPRVVMTLAITGIVFGSLGTLCLGMSSVLQLITMLNPQMIPAMRQQGAAGQPLQVASGLLGLALSIVLLVGAIGCLRLKPWARVLLIRWALVDVFYDTMKMFLTFFVVLPQLANNPAFVNNPQGAQALTAAKVGGAVFGVLVWLVTAGYAVAVMLMFKQPETVKAFEQAPR